MKNHKLLLFLKRHLHAWSNYSLLLFLILSGVVPAFFIIQHYPPTEGVLVLVFLTLLMIFFLYKKVSEVFFKDYFLHLLVSFVVLSFGLRCFFVFSFDQNFYSDFRIMWQHAIQVVETGWIVPSSLQTERPLASLIPLVAMFGKSPLVFKLFNVVIITLQNILCACLARWWFSPLAGLICFFFLSLIPEFYFASLIPSHDISGSFYWIVYIGIFFSFIFSIKKNFLLSLLLFGVLTFIGLVLEVQRGVFAPAFLSLFLFSVWFFSKNRSFFREKRGVFVFFSLFLLQGFLVVSGKKFLSTQGVLVKRGVHKKYSRLFIRSHSFTNGSFSNGKSFLKKYMLPVKSANAKASKTQKDLSDYIYYAKAIPLSDLYYNWDGRFINCFQRIKSFLRMGFVSFYYSRLKGVTKEKQEELNKNFRAWNVTHNGFFALLLLLAYMMVGYGIVFKKRLSSGLVLPLLSSGVFILAIGLVSENQPRYAYLCWPFFALSIAGSFDRSFRKKDIEKSPSLEFSWQSFLSYLLVIALLLGSFFSWAGLSWYRLVSMESFGSASCEGKLTPKECKKAQMSFRRTLSHKPFSALMLNHPKPYEKGSSVSVGKIFKLKKDVPHKVAFFVNAKKIEGFQDFPLMLQVLVNGSLEREFSYKQLKKNRFIWINNLVGTTEIRFKVTSLGSGEIKSFLDDRRPAIYVEFLSLREATL